MTPLAPFLLASFLLSGVPGFDTVLLQNGGRIVGTVVEESPAAGVTVQIPGGQLRNVPPAEVFRIEYRDGTFGVLGASPKPAPPPAEPEAPPVPVPPAAPPPPPSNLAPPPPPPPPPPSGLGPPPPPPSSLAPPPPPQVYPAVPVGPPSPPPYPPHRRALQTGAPGRFTMAFGMGLLLPGGDAEPGVAMSDVFDPQLAIDLEAGVRLTPHLTASLVLDAGFGALATSVQGRCRAAGGTDCTGLSIRYGLQLRYAFTPAAPATTWVSVGTGGEQGILSYDPQSSLNDVTYRGWELVRFGVGHDFRTAQGLGWGPFASIGFTRYSQLEDALSTTTIQGERTHTWIQLGVRLILNP